MDDFDDDEVASTRRTSLHSKDMLANILALVERPNPYFIAVTGAVTMGQLFKLRDGLVVGRAIGVDLPLREEGISRRHASIRVNDENRVFVSDLGSSNGVFVNGTKIAAETLLTEGDFVQLGSTVLMLTYFADRNSLPGESVDAPVDPVTLLPLRPRFLMELNEAFAAATERQVGLSLTLFAVEGLDVVASKVGSSAVDDLLSKLGRSIRESIHGDDSMVARYADEEFAIMEIDAEEGDPSSLASWLKTLPMSAAVLKSKAAPAAGAIEICIGQVQRGKEHKSATDLLRAARRALYLDRAQRLGRPA